MSRTQSPINPITPFVVLAWWCMMLFIMQQDAQAIEEAAYQVEFSDGDFEVRAYEPHILAEVTFDDFDEAQSQGFRLLFKYISGGNRSQAKIAMTAPVGQEPVSEKIAMTAPVGQVQAENGWRLSFMMPASYTMETIPQPMNDAVTLREVPARRIAAVRYSGRWTRTGFEKHKALLAAWMASKNLGADGEAVWARYNAPFTPWFWRRNEVLIPIAP
jgi:hypothetical protein